MFLQIRDDIIVNGDLIDTISKRASDEYEIRYSDGSVSIITEKQFNNFVKSSQCIRI